MSTYKSIDDVIKEIEHWIRLSTLLHSGLQQAILSVLHNDNNDASYVGLPKDPKKLYNELNTTHLPTLTKLKNKKIIKDSQWNKLFPTSGETNSEILDVTLICILIINCTNLPPPPTGWNHNKLLPTDNSKGAAVLRCREWRNFLNHTEPISIDLLQFKQKWKEGDDIIKALGYAFDANKLQTLPLDEKTFHKQGLIIKALDDLLKIEVKSHGDKLDEMQKVVKDYQDQLKLLVKRIEILERRSISTSDTKGIAYYFLIDAFKSIFSFWEKNFSCSIFIKILKF